MPSKFGKFTYCAGDHVLMHYGDDVNVEFGKFCSIGTGVEILCGGNHRGDWITTSPLNLNMVPNLDINHVSSKGDVIVGNDVWIGMHARILSGVTIGDGAIVGAFSVVSRDVPPYAIVAGNPAEIKKYRFPDDVIETLLQIKWWNWPDETICNVREVLLSCDINKLTELASGRG